MIVMLPENRIPTHPGEVLNEEFLKPLNMSFSDFAKHISMRSSRVPELIRGQCAVTPELAWKFAQALGTTPE